MKKLSIIAIISQKITYCQHTRYFFKKFVNLRNILKKLEWCRMGFWGSDIDLYGHPQNKVNLLLFLFNNTSLLKENFIIFC